MNNNILDRLGKLHAKYARRYFDSDDEFGDADLVIALLGAISTIVTVEEERLVLIDNVTKGNELATRLIEAGDRLAQVLRSPTEKHQPYDAAAGATGHALAGWESVREQP